jgi:hypothetical protein
VRQRGRKGSGHLTIISGGTVEPIERPRPPQELSVEEAAEWRAVVEALPADFFGRETHALLVQHCRHVVRARRIAELLASIEAASEFDMEAYGAALAMQTRETAAIARLATRMRLAQQASVDRRQERPRPVVKPWLPAG